MNEVHSSGIRFPRVGGVFFFVWQEIEAFER